MINKLRDWVINWLSKPRPLPPTPLSDFERIRSELKACDILLVEGRSRVSEVIKVITQSSWSHAALYIGPLDAIADEHTREAIGRHYTGPPDQPLLIESELGMGTVVRPLSVYQGEHLRICRPRGLGAGNGQKVINYAARRLGTPYDVRQILDLARFLFPWSILPRRWRSSLFAAKPGMSTHTVCSTMIAEAFGSIHFPILPLVKRTRADKVQLFMRNPKLCTPSDFDYSPYFDIIKYPFLDIAHYSGLHLLPWKGAATLSEEERGIYLIPEADARDILFDDIQ